MENCQFEITTLEGIAERLIELGQAARYILKETEVNNTTPRELIDPENYEVELTQVAAVAIAALTDYRMQQNPDQDIRQVEADIIAAVMKERVRQDTKFNRSYPCFYDPLLWCAVLTEEGSEIAREVRFGTSESEVNHPPELKQKFQDTAVRFSLAHPDSQHNKTYKEGENQLY